ncbi:AI-2E family transporter [Gynuella sp.]|uniref:AI-2E family transporter n=1 Tax=Gynuella sp. TaxID=2969146 RepID=UPI003D0DDB63
MATEKDLMVISDTQKWLVLVSVLLFGMFIYLLSPILSPFLVGIALAYMGDPLVDRLEKLKLSRTLSVVVTFAVLLLVLVAIGLILVPKLASQFRFLAEIGPEAIVRFQKEAIPWINQNVGVDLDAIDWSSLGATINWKETGSIVTKTLARVTTSGIAVAAFIGNLVLIPVVTFYLLRDWDIMVARIGDLIPRNYYQTSTKVAQECHEMLGAFLRGQLLVMLALGIMYSIGLWVVGLKLALLIGLVAGLASIVPYMGFVVGIGFALIAAMLQFQDWMPLLWVCLVFAIGQMVEGMLLTPLLVGDRIGLHPVAVIFAVLAGGQLFGFVGILIGLPVAAVIMVLLRHLHANYKGSSLYGKP